VEAGVGAATRGAYIAIGGGNHAVHGRSKRIDQQGGGEAYREYCRIERLRRATMFPAVAVWLWLWGYGVGG
jgi:hypothetical protein